ncbi:hypothetical protein Droror1_Dr00028241, partial [Drosera rotundifolia]
MVERAVTLKGAMGIAKAAGVEGVEKILARIRSRGGRTRRRDSSNNKSGSSGTGYTQHPQCR